MSNLVCPVCGSSNIQTERRPDGFHHCMECRYSWAIGASQQKQTVFDRITESVEALSPCFVEKQTDNWDDVDYPYYSYLTKEWYATEDEAIAATVEALKKEWNN